MTHISNNKNLIIIISVIIIFAILWFLYKNFYSEKYLNITERYNDIMQKLIDDENLNFDEIILYQDNYIDNINKYKKEYEILKTIYSEKLANLSSILNEISNQDIILKDKNKKIEDSLDELNKLISAGTDAKEVIKFINDNILEKFEILKIEIENRKKYFDDVQNKIEKIKGFISYFNDTIKNYNESLEFGKELKEKISKSEVATSLEELDNFRKYIEINVKDAKIKKSFNDEIDILKSKLDNIISLIEKQSENAIRELNSDNDLDIYQKNIEKFRELTTNNETIIKRISLFLVNFSSQLETIKNTNELFKNIKELDISIKDLRDLIESLKTI